jgi:hypothetical protein
MSSCVVYNSVGVIDENTLNEFAVVVNIGNLGKRREFKQWGIMENKGKIKGIREFMGFVF